MARQDPTSRPRTRQTFADSLDAEARFQAGRKRALAQMNPPKTDPLGDIVRKLAKHLGLGPAGDSLDKSKRDR